MAQGLGSLVESARDQSADASGQLEALLVRLQANTLEFPDDTQLILRELLDNRERAEGAHHWPMKRFLDQLTGLVRRAAPTLSDSDALAHVYAMLGAINFFAASQPTLREMYGKDVLAALRARFPEEIRRLTRAG